MLLTKDDKINLATAMAVAPDLNSLRSYLREVIENAGSVSFQCPAFDSAKFNAMPTVYDIAR